MTQRAVCSHCGSEIPFIHAVEDELRERGLWEESLAICLARGGIHSIVFRRANGKRSRFSRQHTFARAHVFKLLHDRGLSYPEIGAIWNMDHTSVISAVRVAKYSPLSGPLSHKEIAELREIEKKDIAELEERDLQEMRRAG